MARGQDWGKVFPRYDSAGSGNIDIHCVCVDSQYSCSLCCYYADGRMMTFLCAGGGTLLTRRIKTRFQVSIVASPQPWPGLVIPSLALRPKEPLRSHSSMLWPTQRQSIQATCTRSRVVRDIRQRGFIIAFWQRWQSSRLSFSVKC